MEVVPGIHRLEVPFTDRIVCVVLVVSGGQALIFDTAVAGGFEAVVFPYLEALGVGPEMLGHVVVSHADFDHFGANAELRAWAPEASFLCHARDRREIEDVEVLIGERYGEFAGAHGLPSDPAVDAYVRDVTHATPIDGTLEEGDVLRVGDLLLQVMHVPGHSRGHLAFYEPESRCAVIGDAVLGTACPSADGTPALPPTYRYVDDYLASIDRLEQMPVDTLVSGHFPVMRGVEIQAFLDASRAFTARADAALLDELHGSSLTTKELVDEVGSTIGDWPEAGVGLSVFPIVGHLEQLESTGRIERTSNGDGLILWSGAS